MLLLCKAGTVLHLCNAWLVNSVSSELFYFCHHHRFHFVTTISTPSELRATEVSVTEGGAGAGRPQTGLYFQPRV